MAFNPSSTITLYNVPIDNTYQNQLIFESIEQQDDYFVECKPQKVFTDYLTVRETSPDGSLINAIKVDANIDDLRQYNYMSYGNANHSTKTFYAFIKQFVYVSEGVTKIIYEQDVWNTWMFDIEILQSYVEREHASTDGIGYNVTPESFNFEDYEFTEIHAPLEADDITDFGYLIGTSDLVKVDGNEIETIGTLQTGVFQGMYFYYFPENVGLSSFLLAASNVSDCVQFIVAIPKFNVENAVFVDESSYGLLKTSKNPASRVLTFQLSGEVLKFGEYVPKNKKLLSSPFLKLVVTNNSGSQAEYNIEDFFTATIPQFKMYGDISTNPSITLIPYEYKNVRENVDHGISMGGFPQCSFNSDTFKLWLAKNQFGIALDGIANIGSIIAGIGVTASTGGAGSALGVSQIINGVQGVASTINNVYQASKEPNSTKGGAPKNNLLTAMKRNGFNFYIRTIKEDYAKTIDDYFTMYGYKTNKLKIPNLYNRSVFNYVKTIDVNIKGNIPSDDMRIIKAMFNNGVTLWHNGASVGNYDVNNEIVYGR